ncbi:hypothetical protein BWI17_19290 [Betaproteobacteria bacterium GR16-43]|nr:hypothetical protein BWI17_19290 [Betaproteobacteria bacterium GR16-43]
MDYFIEARIDPMGLGDFCVSVCTFAATDSVAGPKARTTANSHGAIAATSTQDRLVSRVIEAIKARGDNVADVKIDRGSLAGVPSNGVF